MTFCTLASCSNQHGFQRDQFSKFLDFPQLFPEKLSFPPILLPTTAVSIIHSAKEKDRQDDSDLKFFFQPLMRIN